MLDSKRFQICFCTALCFLFPSFSSAQISQDVLKSFDVRSDALAKYRYEWSLERTINRKQAPKDVLDRAMQQAENRAKMRIIDDNVTDENLKKKYFSTETALIKQLLSGGESSSTSKVIANRQGNDIQVDGDMIDPPSHIETKHIYIGNTAIFYTESASSGGIKTEIGPIPLVLGAKGNAINQNLGNGDFMDIFPIDLTLLCNINPLRLFEDKWQLTSNKNNTMIASQTIKDDKSEQRYEMTLDLTKNVIISCYISSPSKGYDFHYIVKSFKKFNNYYIPDVFEHIRVIGNVKTIDYWKLIKISLSKPVSFDDIPKKLMISDTRLKGNNLSGTEVDDALKWGDSEYLQYAWDGHLPDLNQLKGIKNQLHSHDIIDRPNKMGLYLIPGVLMIALGLFLKIRKLKENKLANK